MKVTIQPLNKKFVIAIETFRCCRPELELGGNQKGKMDRLGGPLGQNQGNFLTCLTSSSMLLKSLSSSPVSSTRSLGETVSPFQRL